MKKGYEVKMRERTVKPVIEQGKSRREVGEIFGVHCQSVRNWVECYKKTGNVVGKRVQVKPYQLDWEKLRKDVEEPPEAYLAERAKKFGVATATIWGDMNKMGIRPKKTASPIRNQTKVKNRNI